MAKDELQERVLRKKIREIISESGREELTKKLKLKVKKEEEKTIEEIDQEEIEKEKESEEEEVPAETK